MTVSATWLKATLLLPLLLAGCQSNPDASTQAPPPAPLQPKTAADASPQQPLPPGLTPLPTPQQVVMAQPVGRVDPFQPVASSGPGGTNVAAPPPLPSGFSFQGVIRSGGQAQALVQFGGESGTLRPGDVGGRSTKLLPAGWAVGGIDVARGRLILRASGRAIAVSLDAQG